MASPFTTISLLTIFLVLQPWTSTCNFLSPFFSPVFDEVCKHVECGKGNCMPSNNSIVPYICECERGWKQALSDDDDGNNSMSLPCLFPNYEVCKHVECGKGNCMPSNNSIVPYICECERGWKRALSDDDDGNNSMFLPCLFPNCTLNFSCTEAQSPVKENDNKPYTSLDDPCYWVDCGGGMCNKTSQFTYKCDCRDGYSNLLNVTSFPCYLDCAFGVDCANLGIPVMNRSNSSPTSGLAGDGRSQVTASSIKQGNFNWLIIISMSLAPIMWKLLQSTG